MKTYNEYLEMCCQDCGNVFKATEKVSPKHYVVGPCPHCLGKNLKFIGGK